VVVLKMLELVRGSCVSDFGKGVSGWVSIFEELYSLVSISNLSTFSSHSITASLTFVPPLTTPPLSYLPSL